MKPKHTNGKIDARYTVELEFTGAPRAQYVARFCGDWIGAANLQRDAWQLARTHQAQRVDQMTRPAMTLPHSFRSAVKARPCFGVDLNRPRVPWSDNVAIAACLIIGMMAAAFL